jgi:hypothetical protein
MMQFLQQHAKIVLGMVSGWDRLRFQGSLRSICHPRGLGTFLGYTRRFYKGFKSFALESSAQLKAAALKVAKDAERPVRHLPSPKISKEQVARQIAREDGITEGLICAITAVESCSSFEIRKDRVSGRIDFHRDIRKCLHIYHYYLHPVFGFMHVRLQTWLPFGQFICINGREWLSRQLDAAGIDYLRKENCFVRLADIEAAQRMLDEQVNYDWRPALDRIANSIAPTLGQVLMPYPSSYYGSIQESEWATDFMFSSTKALSALYPSLLHHGITSFGCHNVMRFLGQKVPLHGNAFAGQKRQIVSDLRGRAEGVRLKHRMGSNSVKIYNKQGSVLRVETTLNDVRELKSPRRKPDGTVQWQQMRKGIADARQRAQVSQTANQRYVEAISSIATPTTLASLTESLSRPVHWNKQQVRGLNLLAEHDARLLETISKAEFLLHGLRNRDLQAVLFTTPAQDEKEKHRRSAQISRKLRMLRAHGLLHKLPHTHRYVVSVKGRQVITALIAARQADITKLSKAA